MLRTVMFTLFLSTSALVTACQGDQFTVEPVDTPEFSEEPFEVILPSVSSEEHEFRVVRILRDLNHPWSVSWLPDGRMLVTERSGRLLLAEGDQAVPVGGLPEIQSQGQGGLLDVVVHPDYDTSGWIYFTYTAGEGNQTAVVLMRAKLNGTSLTDREELFRESQAKNPGRHYGSRIAFPGDGTLFFTIGDRGQRTPSQDLGDPAGSTLRLNEDGTIPSDNPFVNDPDVRPEIYSYGHRNAQGMAIHPETGAVWQHEHGPRGGDALNVIRAGNNYGWPVATYGRNYGTMTRIGIEPHEDPAITNPITWWEPTSIAPSGMAFYYDGPFTVWKGDLFIGALGQRHLLRLVLDGEEVIHQEKMLDGDLGRIRDVRTGPDGFIYLLTDQSNGGLYRVEPGS